MNEKCSIEAISDLTEQNIGQRVYMMCDMSAQIQGKLSNIYPHPTWPETFCVIIEGTVSGNPWEVFLELPAGKNVLLYEN